MLIAITAGTTKAFLQIVVTEDLFKFWGIITLKTLVIIINLQQNFCVLRVLFGVTLPPLFLSTTLQKHIMTCKHTGSYFTKKIVKSFHVDDLNTGANSI